jgi:quercetin dioxygenase-like cupin family protein
MRVTRTECRRGLFAGLALTGALTLPGSTAFGQIDARGFVRVAPEQVKWVDEPDGLGVQRAIVQGDPAKSGIYVIRVRFPRGVMSNNHRHREDRHAVVLQGTWWTGTGEQFIPERTVPLKAGSYMMHPAGEAHFDGAKDEDVILQLIGYGPSETTPLRPQESRYRSSK